MVFGINSKGNLRPVDVLRLLDTLVSFVDSNSFSIRMIRIRLVSIRISKFE